MKNLLFIFLILPLCLFSQENTTKSIAEFIIEGKVLDEKSNEDLPYATVSILNRNNELISGALTNKTGDFSIKISDIEDISITIQFMGYQNFNQKIEMGGKKTLNINTIYLKELVQELDGVEVVAERTSIEQKIDRKVINIGKDIASAGTDGTDVMKNIPNVDIDQDGNVSLRGNQNVKIMVDGKLSNLEASQLLQQIPASSIKSIELITNPSAKYDPEGMSGIINIILKKSELKGFNGTINLGFTHGVYNKTNANLGFNFRIKKINLYGNFGGRFGNRYFYGFSDRLDNASNQYIEFVSGGPRGIFKFGLDYYITKNTTFSIFTNQTRGERDVAGYSNLRFKHSPNLNVESSDTNFHSNNGQTYNSNLVHTFKNGEKLNIEANINVNDNLENSNYIYSDTTNYKDYTEDIKSNILAQQYNIDYTHPLANNIKIEVGTELKDNTFSNIYEHSSDLNTSFNYDVQIYSGYGIISQKIGKFGYQAGVRVEQFNIDAKYDVTGKYSYEKLSFYPSTFLTYTPNEVYQWQVSYSRRVDRPSIHQTNPVRQWSTPQITSIGNPKLTPQFTDSYELNMTFNKEKTTISSGIFYRQINNNIVRVMYLDPSDPNKSIRSYINSDDNYAFGFDATWSYRPLDWYDLFLSFDMNQTTEKGLVADKYYEVESVKWKVNWRNNFKIIKNLKGQVNFGYRAGGRTLQFIMKDRWHLDAGLRYSFWKRNGTISFNVNDIFRTQKWAYSSERPFPSEGEFRWESHNYRVGFSYKFGNQKFQELKRKRRDKNESRSGGFM